MKRFPFKKIDAFAAGGSSGNPAACVYLTEEASPEDMQRIARELGGFVSEVVYCLPVHEDGIDFSLRYYSSECEVAFCGHGTIACMYDLITHDPELLNREEIMIRTSRGDLAVYNRIGTMDAVYISAPLPTPTLTTKPLKNTTVYTTKTLENTALHNAHPTEALEKTAVAARLGLPGTRLDDSLPLDLINAGLDTLIVPIRSLTDILAIWPDESALRDYCIEIGADIITVFTRDARDKANTVHTRVFAPRFGYLEDPATGSGNSALGYYLLKNGLWDGAPMSIEQGPGPIFNRIKLNSLEQPGGSRRVLFGGAATVRFEGHYFL